MWRGSTNPIIGVPFKSCKKMNKVCFFNRKDFNYKYYVLKITKHSPKCNQ